MTHKWKVKPTKKQKRIIKEWWDELQHVMDLHRDEISRLEKSMERETGIKDIEFFISKDDGGYYGVGNAKRTMKLIELLGGVHERRTRKKTRT